MSMIFTALLLSISANLDTLLAAISYGTKKIRFNLIDMGIVTIITTLGTFISMGFGIKISNLVSIEKVELIGNLLLVCIGIYMLFDYYRKEKRDKLVDKPNEVNDLENISKVTILDEKRDKKVKYSDILKDPIKADKNHNGTIDIKECFALSFALTINNLGIGIGGSMAGVNIYLNTTFTFIITIVSLIIGLKIGSGVFASFLGKYAGIISGVIIIFIGIYDYL